MKSITDILSGIGVLIALYLVLYNADASVNLVSTIINSASNGIKVLQGRG